MIDVGDRVVVINKGYIENKKVRNRDKGTVIDIAEFKGMYSLCVEMDRDINGHDCNGFGKDGHCVWVSPRSLALEVKGN